MSGNELKEFSTLSELILAIDQRYSDWETIYCFGSEDGISDGCVLNILRSEIKLLRERKERLFPSELEGQLGLEGFSVKKEEDRPLPIELPMDWESPASRQKRKNRIRARMQEILKG